VKPKTTDELIVCIDAMRVIVAAAGDGEAGYEAAADFVKNVTVMAYEWAAAEQGVTGFQAEWAALHAAREMLGVQGPMGVFPADRMLYPQHPTATATALKWTVAWTPWLAKEAKRLLAENKPEEVAKEVWAHWEHLAMFDAPAAEEVEP
jgi:hypothetical protein